MKADPGDRNRGGFGSLSCFALAILVLAVGGLAYLGELHKAEMRRLALSNDPPALTQIAALQATDIGPAGEARIIAQVDFTLRQTVGFDGVPGLSNAYILPLLPSDATGAIPPQALGVLIYTGDAANFNDTSLEALLTNIVGVGQFGPILELHGLTEENWQYGPLISRAFDGANRPLSDNPLIFAPLQGSRATALEPTPPGASMIVASGVAGLLLVLGVGLIAFGSGAKAKKKKAAIVTHVMLSPYAPQMVSGEDGARAVQKLLVPNGSMGADMPGGVYSPPKEGLTEFAQTTDPLDAYESEITYLEERLNHAAKAGRRSKRRPQRQADPGSGPTLTVHSNDHYDDTVDPGQTAELEAVEYEAAPPDVDTVPLDDADPFVRRLDRLK
ncbi:hypothetical protein [Actibacterium sp. 188UL27-1]|uniref:hypothetical protein n=1 Tax=Actibacterium sp. 188UL27-1 TaxID=2786961 RepID=UPI001959DC96|nr:hypothetical protein [Actibacterium sp. 188UL27-1]MBM7066226.1 hypothetical protein [Actibacterium sp. 188UL27-1]